MRVDKYRANAEFCERMAGRATRYDDTAAWQRLAQSWLILVKGEERLTTARSATSRATLRQRCLAAVEEAVGQGGVDGRQPLHGADSGQAVA